MRDRKNLAGVIEYLPYVPQFRKKRAEPEVPVEVIIDAMRIEKGLQARRVGREPPPMPLCKGVAEGAEPCNNRTKHDSGICWRHRAPLGSHGREIEPQGARILRLVKEREKAPREPSRAASVADRVRRATPSDGGPWPAFKGRPHAWPSVGMRLFAGMCLMGLYE